ncbi:hypothetical protein KSZ_43060 [Dictyobacter formicarum]|uniref:Two-component sensor histidine kinase n=2 Tax=Dictyobacter formicarum TaxID=2778368 RepID=A0ABQ3VJB0_9CHLR|nr:hypothetical protein KSZ_43060 [Dictyobacter formicarum]
MRVILASKTLMISFVLATDIIALVLAVQIILSIAHTPLPTTLLTEILFLATALIEIFARTMTHIVHVFIMYSICLLLSLLLNLLFPGNWGLFSIYIVCSIAVYRFPLPWALPLVLVSIAILTVSSGITSFLTSHRLNSLLPLLPFLAAALGISWVSWTRRSQFLLIHRLQEVQKQLQAEMQRSEALAAERERTRIARDIHDVLSHTLSVLSIQVQAARQLASRDPARLATKLDDMAILIRESIAESRRVVGLLREAPAIHSGKDNLAGSLNTQATTFSERTGIHCFFKEEGTPPTHETLNSVQYETLQYALREMLTNAHRHGAASTIWITLRWREAVLTLQVRDDGKGQIATTSAASAIETGNVNTTYGHHGLQGMRERAAALDGDVEAGPLEAGGFSITLRIPFKYSRQQSQEV